jgi:flavin-dependent dehydrogenase
LIPNDTADDHTMSLWYSARYKGGYKYIFPYGPGKAKLGFIKDTDEYHGPVFEMQAKQAGIGGIQSFVRGNIVLIGGAAAFANPFTGGGIKAGFTAARVLARRIVKAADGTTGDSRTERMVAAIEKFETWWKRSGYYSGKYMKAYEQFKVMDDATILRLAKPFLVKGKVRKAIAFLENITLWSIYKAFMNSARYS